MHEYVLGSTYLQPYQLKKKKMWNLNKYDQFFRIVGEPFIWMHLEIFMADLNELILKLEIEYEKNHPGRTFNMDRIPYVQFLEHFKDKPDWKSAINDLNSPFMKLLQLENLFFVK